MSKILAILDKLELRELIENLLVAVAPLGSGTVLAIYHDEDYETIYGITIGSTEFAEETADSLEICCSILEPITPEDGGDGDSTNLN